MTQVVNAEPEVLSEVELRQNETAQILPVGSPEHAALVDAIKQNFPEIYQAPDRTEIGKSYGKPAAWNTPVPAPSSA
jgi:hypothetical protein